MWNIVVCVVMLNTALLAKADNSPWVDIQNFMEDVKSNATMTAAFNSHFQQWNQLDSQPKIQPFKCDVSQGRSSKRPTTVHRLRPGDIDVTAVIGDSLSAAACAKATSILTLLFEWRGVSWSDGGDKSIDEGVYTLPNVIKKFNPKVVGYSTGVIPVLTQGLNPSKTQYNMAVSGAKSKDILTQAENLVDRLKKDRRIDFENDWKLVTLFIGGNDLCAYCKDEKAYSYTTYKANIKKTLDYLKQNLPRAYVNLVMMIDLTQLSQIHNGLVCGILHRFLCPCASFPKTEVDRQAIISQTVEYSEVMLDVIADGSYDQTEDFTVVAQPFFVNQRLPSKKDGEPDLSYFSPDCFHFSAKGHASAAQAVWNNMMEPAGKKRLSWFLDEPWYCPTDNNPYIYTYQNSEMSLAKTKAGLKDNLVGDNDVQSTKELEDLDLTTNKKETNWNNQPSQLTQSILPGLAGFCAGVILVLLVFLVILTLRGRAREEKPEKYRLI